MHRLFWPVLIMLITLVALLLGVEAYAQNYSYYTYTPNCYPYYQAPVKYSNQTYYEEKVYPAQKVVAQEIAVAPLIVTIPVESKAVPVHAYGSPYYYSASEAYREKAYLREVLREELRNLLTTGGVSSSTSSSLTSRGLTSRVTTPTTPSTPANSKIPLTWGPDTTTPADIQQKVLASYQGKANCISCHGGGGRDSGNFKLILDDGKGNYQLTKQTSDKRWKIYGMASVGAMPPAAATDASKAMEAQHLPVLLQYAALKD